MNLPTYKGKPMIPFTPLRQSLTGLQIFRNESGSANIEDADGRCPMTLTAIENTAMRHIEKRNNENETEAVNGSESK